VNNKRLLFHIILILPAVVLGSILLATARDVWSIHRVNPVEIYRALETHLDNKAPRSFPLPDAIHLKNKTKKSIFVFGASALVLSDSDKTFTDYLQEHHDDLHIVNFGVVATDSLSVKQRVREALSESRPDLIILYFGDNDYNAAYQGFVLPKYFDKFDCLLKLSYYFFDKERPVGELGPDDYYWFARLNRPRLLQMLQKLRMLSFDPGSYTPVNRSILEHFRKNNEAIVGMASSLKIPVILITPVGNLRAEPFGGMDTTTALYKRGLAASDYHESLHYLRMAVDTELFTYDLRAKTGLLDYIRNYEHPDVYVLDLEKKLEQRNFSFGDSDFVDYVHFNDKSHRLLAGILYDFMVQKNLLKGPPGRGK